jgi:hypothetical protein
MRTVSGCFKESSLKTVDLVASGDLRLLANQNCWAAQDAMEKQVSAAVDADLGNITPDVATAEVKAALEGCMLVLALRLA